MGNDETPRMLLLIAAAADVVRRIPVAMVARGFKGKQKFTVTVEDLLQIVRNFRKRGTGDLVIDYDHSTEFAAGGGEAVPAAGWLKTIDDSPDANGVLWGAAEFTKKAAKMLAAREYKYVSPVIHWGVRDKVTGEQQGTTITSIALTNSPLLENLPAIAFSEGWGGWGGVTVKSELDGAVKARKITPTQRPFYEQMAMSDLPAFKALVATMRPDGTTLPEGSAVVTVKPAKTLTPESAKTELDDLMQQLHAAIGKLMDQEGLNHLDALSKVYEDSPDFVKREQQLRDYLKMAKDFPAQVELSESRASRGGKENMTFSECESALNGIDAELRIKTQAKMAGTNLQYHEALKLVAREHPYLAKERDRLYGELRGARSGAVLVASELEEVETLINQEVRGKIMESGGKVQYHEALKLVAREHPDLDRRRTKLMRG